MEKINKKDYWAVNLRWPVSLYRGLRRAAKSEMRSLPNYVERVLADHLARKGAGK